MSPLYVDPGLFSKHEPRARLSAYCGQNGLVEVERSVSVLEFGKNTPTATRKPAVVL